MRVNSVVEELDLLNRLLLIVDIGAYLDSNSGQGLEFLVLKLQVLANPGLHVLWIHLGWIKLSGLPIFLALKEELGLTLEEIGESFRNGLKLKFGGLLGII